MKIKEWVTKTISDDYILRAGFNTETTSGAGFKKSISGKRPGGAYFLEYSEKKISFIFVHAESLLRKLFPLGSCCQETDQLQRSVLAVKFIVVVIFTDYLPAKNENLIENYEPTKKSTYLK
jgi:hypothetical protein